MEIISLAGESLREDRAGLAGSALSQFKRKLLYLGEIVESGPTKKMFTAPDKQQTREYISGQFG